MQAAETDTTFLTSLLSFCKENFTTLVTNSRFSTLFTHCMDICREEKLYKFPLTSLYPGTTATKLLKYKSYGKIMAKLILKCSQNVIDKAYRVLQKELRAADLFDQCGKVSILVAFLQREHPQAVALLAEMLKTLDERVKRARYFSVLVVYLDRHPQRFSSILGRIESRVDKKSRNVYL